jgi:threonine aldolase
MDTIDLRSDTVSWPTPEMREAMATAEVGDDVYGEDPTVNRLEALAAERLGKEAALFVASGTQGNLIAILAHCGRGDEVIVGKTAHTFRSEAGGAAALGGINPHTVPVQEDGTIALDDIRGAVRDPHNLHHPFSRLVCLENTHGAAGGLPITAEYTQSVRDVCRGYGLGLHLDGARVWNAATALGCDVKDLVGPVDSVSFCLSKGLCAPAGSILCGPADFIQQARRIRKLLGGGMRQAGILAAAGIIAVEQMTQRLDQDHANARRLAEGLMQIEGFHLDLDKVRTNMVFYSIDESLPLDAYQLAEAVKQSHNVLLGATGPHTFRSVTHYWITAERVDVALNAIREALEAAA